MHGGDPLRIVEAAYRWEANEVTWLAGVAEAAAPFGAGRGVVASTLRCLPKVRWGATGTTDGARTEDARAIEAFSRALSPEVVPSMFAPTEFVGNAGHRLARLARGLGASVHSLTRGSPLPGMWAVVGGAPADRSIFLSFLAPADVPTDAPFPGDSRVLGLVGAHLGAALRLRAIGKPSTDDPENDAVLSPSGRILHSEREAKEAPLRESLTEAVLRSERARGRLRKADTIEATELWSALVEGRWSIVETTDHDGKRFLLARKNPLASRDLIGLTKEESDVAWLAVHGHSYKYMAYELGLSVPTVTRRLRGALKKLRLSSRRELLRKIGL
jgi:DNA-binding CsgD family transcriptional regulator